MNTFIKIYVLISLWFWAGMLLSEPLRSAFENMHWRVLQRIYNATIGQILKALQATKLLAKKQVKKLRMKVTRMLIGEIMQPNIIYAIARERNIRFGSSGVLADDLLNMLQLAGGNPVDYSRQVSAVTTAFNVCDTFLFEEVIAKVPHAQERILLAFDQLEGRDPSGDINKEQGYCKFVRE